VWACRPRDEQLVEQQAAVAVGLLFSGPMSLVAAVQSPVNGANTSRSWFVLATAARDFSFELNRPPSMMYRGDGGGNWLMRRRTYVAVVGVVGVAGCIRSVYTCAFTELPDAASRSKEKTLIA
jgi:hypothetical protein